MAGENSFLNNLDRLKKKKFFRMFYYFTLYSMAFTFVASGLRKFPGIRFTNLGLDNPVGLFFEGMLQTGVYWHFIGYFQLVTGIMLFVKRLRPLAIIFVTIISVNIFLISVGLNMRGTPIITGAMLLGSIFLMLWHHKNYITVFQLYD